jgi:integrase
MRLTNQTTANLQLAAGDKDRTFFDEKLQGFGVRVRAGGSRTWIVRYRIGRKQRCVKLGKVGVVDADTARQKAKEILARVQLGGDPQQERADDNKKDELTLGAASEKYLIRAKLRMRPSSYNQVKRHFDLHLAPLKNRPIRKIERAEILERFSEITDSGAPVAANRAMETAGAFFAWAMREGMVESNPVIGANKNKERSRERVLTETELKAVWHASCGGDDFARIIRLLILTGARAAEIAGLCRSEVQEMQHKDDRILALSLPGERTKNRLPHLLLLSEVARALLPAKPDENGTDRDFLFGRCNGPLSGWSRCKARLDKRSGVSGWTVHDLRRTVATGMAAVGIAPHVIEACLNHVSGARGSVAGIYNRHGYLDEKCVAFRTWAEHVEKLVRDNVVTFPPQAQAA